MLDLVSDSLILLLSIFDESDRLLLFSAVRVINVSPNTFNVSRIVDVLDHIWIVIGCVAGGEMVIPLPLPDGQSSISHSDIIIFLVHRKPRNEIPGLILAMNQSLWVSCEESQPETVSVFG